MPAIVIHGQDRKAWVVPIETTRVRLGRDPGSCEVVLPGATVSREHARIERDRDGRWRVHCVSSTNPLVVNGVLVDGSAALAEGSEVLVGMEYLVVFADSVVSARAYVGDQGRFLRSVCQDCHWSGMAGGVRRAPTCPRCGGARLHEDAEAGRRTEILEDGNKATEGVDPWEVRAQLERMKVARRSRLEVLDASGRVVGGKALREDQVVRIARGRDADLPLRGLAFGHGIEVSWDGNRYVARSLLWFPAMTVDGKRCAGSPLASGCILAIGGNRFRYVVE